MNSSKSNIKDCQNCYTNSIKTEATYFCTPCLASYCNECKIKRHHGEIFRCVECDQKMCKSFYGDCDKCFICTSFSG